jgi:hypothetical protein
MLMIVKGCEKKSSGVISITRVTVGCMRHTLRCYCGGRPPTWRNPSPTASTARSSPDGAANIPDGAAKPTHCAGLGDSARARAGGSVRAGWRFWSRGPVLVAQSNDLSDRAAVLVTPANGSCSRKVMVCSRRVAILVARAGGSAARSGGSGGSARGGGRALRGVVTAPAAGEGRDVGPHLGRAPVRAEPP